MTVFNLIQKRFQFTGWYIACFILCSAFSLNSAYAQVLNPAAYEKLRQDTIRDVKASFEPLISRYCYDACELINVKAEIQEELTETEDLGFEGVSDRSDKVNYYVKVVTANIQIDDRITIANRARLENIFSNHLKAYGLGTIIDWRPVSIPSIGGSASDDLTLKSMLEQKITAATNSVIGAYCPQQCILSQVSVEGAVIPPDDAAGLPNSRLVTDQAGRVMMRVDQANVEVSMDSLLSQEERDRISSVIQAKLKFVEPLNMAIVVTPFPESYAEKRERLKQESEDPYGLEKLRRMLVMFRELAGTKEIITSDSNTTKSNEQTNTASTSKDRRTDSSAVQELGGLKDIDWIWVVVAALTVLIVVSAVVMKIFGANKDARMLVADAQNGDNPAKNRTQQGGQPLGAGSGNGASDMRSTIGIEKTTHQTSKEMMSRIKAEALKSEMISAFIENPKLARETFSRLLKESGVEETAKYVFLLGQIVIFNLLDDPNLQRELYELSEYYHNTQFTIEPDDELKLLEALKTKVTAAEIRMLSRRATEKFDFLAKLDAEQIFTLISEENAKVQSIVLTQLEKKRRLAVFAMYAGKGKIDLMNELSRSDAIPKEYLNNVANALGRKVTSRPEFDTTNLRSSDVLLDLLERASLNEQRKLMSSLQYRNPETARSLKMRLITIEMLPFLKDGHLLELILGMEREDLLNFLMGTPNHVKDLLLTKAPSELSDSWQEDLGYMASVEDQYYRVVEMKVLARIRNLANNGAISILEINDMIFADQGGAEDYDDGSSGGELANELSAGSMVV
jgi:flagellar motor switch protein FliG